jgi:hypothetical protein
MSLSWDITSVADCEEICYEEARDNDGKTEVDPMTGLPLVVLKPLTNALILATMYLDIGEITEANYEEFAWRARLWSATTGDHMLRLVVIDDDGSEKTEGYNPTVEEVRQHIGLRCNVITTTTAQFMARLRKVWTRDAASRKVRREREAAEAEQALA